jgi:hypothetical protein
MWHVLPSLEEKKSDFYHKQADHTSRFRRENPISCTLSQSPGWLTKNWRNVPDFHFLINRVHLQQSLFPEGHTCSERVRYWRSFIIHCREPEQKPAKQADGRIVTVAESYTLWPPTWGQLALEAVLWWASCKIVDVKMLKPMNAFSEALRKEHYLRTLLCNIYDTNWPSSDIQVQSCNRSSIYSSIRSHRYVRIPLW